MELRVNIEWSCGQPQHSLAGAIHFRWSIEYSRFAIGLANHSKGIFVSQLCDSCEHSWFWHECWQDVDGVLSRICKATIPNMECTEDNDCEGHSTGSNWKFFQCKVQHSSRFDECNFRIHSRRSSMPQPLRLDHTAASLVEKREEVWASCRPYQANASLVCLWGSETGYQDCFCSEEKTNCSSPRQGEIHKQNEDGGRLKRITGP